MKRNEKKNGVFYFAQYEHYTRLPSRMREETFTACGWEFVHADTFPLLFIPGRMYKRGKLPIIQPAACRADVKRGAPQGVGFGYSIRLPAAKHSVMNDKLLLHSTRLWAVGRRVRVRERGSLA